MANPHQHYDAEELSRIDKGNRGKWLRVDDLITESGIDKGMICIDLGCGAGALAIPLTGAVGNTGKVYAVDINKAILDRLKSKNPPENLVMVNSDAAETGLKNAIADYVFIILVLHEAEPDKVLAEAYRLLKPGGKVLAMEWRTDIDLMGPPQQERISKEKLEQLYRQTGFKDFQCKDWTKGQYIATGTK